MNITLPIIMSNTNYYVNAIFNGFNKNQSYNCSLDNCSNNSITIMNNTYTTADFYCFGCRWEVKGYAASSEYTKDKWNYQNVNYERHMIQLK